MWIYACEPCRFSVNDGRRRMLRFSREECLAIDRAATASAGGRSARPFDGSAEVARSSAQERTWQHVKKDGTVIYVEVAGSACALAARAPAWSSQTMSAKARDPSALSDADGHHSSCVLLLDEDLRVVLAIGTLEKSSGPLT